MVKVSGKVAVYKGQFAGIKVTKLKVTEVKVTEVKVTRAKVTKVKVTGRLLCSSRSLGARSRRADCPT